MLRQTNSTQATEIKPVLRQPPMLQRKCGCGQHVSSGECEECKKKKEPGETGDPLLRRSATGRRPINEVSSSVHNAIRYQGQPLDRPTRSRLESSFHCDLSKVRVHADESAARAAREIDARAFTLGQNIWFGGNEFSPRSAGGFHLLAHEVAHTIQQGTQTPVVQRSIAVGAVDDPAEAAADRAADAAAVSGKVPQLKASAPMIRRRSIQGTADPNVRYVVEDDKKTRYKVIRTYEDAIESDKPSNFPKVTPGANLTNVWLELEWCKNQKFDAQIGVNLPEEIKNLAGQLYKAISSGGSASDIIRNASLKPYLNVKITQPGDWELSPGVHLTVNTHGDVTGGGGQLGFEKGPFKVEAKVDVNKDEGTGRTTAQGGVVITVTPGKTSPQPKCPTEKVRIGKKPVYRCVKETLVPPHDETKETEKQVPDTRERYVYFVKSTDNLNSDVAGEGDLSTKNLGELRSDFAEGYKVSGITGFTSPEGPMKPTGTFEGNKALGLRRAKTAMGIVRQNCFPRREDVCFAGDPEKMPADGGELHTLVQKGKEVEGKRLASHAVEEFEGKEPREHSDVASNPDESAQKTPELQKALEKRTTPERQADLIYQKLRRATITLSGTKTVKETTTEHVEGGFQQAGDCPDGVIESAFSRVEESLSGKK
jgi:hypothetical protein